MSDCRDHIHNNVPPGMFPAHNPIVPPASHSLSAYIRRLEKQYAEAGPLVSGGVPKLGEVVQEDPELLAATVDLRFPNETINSLIGRSQLSPLQLRTWDHTSIRERIAEVERQQYEQAVTESQLKPGF
jgi:hypothetical protein